MKLPDYALLVLKTRNAQKKYFETRKKGYLFRSKELEKELDKATEIILNDNAHHPIS